MSFDSEFNRVIPIEGDFSDQPSDSGGQTRWGITEAVARAEGYQGPMRELPLVFAKQIYRKRYWDVLRLDEIEQVAPLVARELFDTGINCGVGNAAEWLQTALENFNRRAKDYPDIGVDGSIGPATIAALKSLFSVRGKDAETQLLKALNAFQAVHYMRLGNRPTTDKDEDFMWGWFKNRVAI